MEKLKKYTAPEVEIILFEVNDSIMAEIGDSREDPWGFNSFFTHPGEFQQWLNDQPNGTIIDEDMFGKKD